MCQPANIFVDYITTHHIYDTSYYIKHVYIYIHIHIHICIHYRLYMLEWAYQSIYQYQRKTSALLGILPSIEVPKIIHFIWLCSPLADKRAENLRGFAAWTGNVWLTLSSF